MIVESGLHVCSHTLAPDGQLLYREETVCWSCALGLAPRVNEHVRAAGERHDSLNTAFGFSLRSLIYSHVRFHADSQNQQLIVHFWPLN